MPIKIERYHNRKQQICFRLGENTSMFCSKLISVKYHSLLSSGSCPGLVVRTLSFADALHDQDLSKICVQHLLKAYIGED